MRFGANQKDAFCVYTFLAQYANTLKVHSHAEPASVCNTVVMHLLSHHDKKICAIIIIVAVI